MSKGGAAIRLTLVIGPITVLDLILFEEMEAAEPEPPEEDDEKLQKRLRGEE